MVTAKANIISSSPLSISVVVFFDSDLNQFLQESLSHLRKSLLEIFCLHSYICVVTEHNSAKNTSLVLCLSFGLYSQAVSQIIKNQEKL
jgi:hypothetical protein